MAWQYQSGDYNSPGGAVFYDPATQKFKISAPPHSLVIGNTGGAVNQPIYNDQSYTVKQWQDDPYGRIGFGKNVDITMQPGEMYNTFAPKIRRNFQFQPQQTKIPTTMASTNQFSPRPPLDTSMANWMNQ
jgi:hypothetical protein